MAAHAHIEPEALLDYAEDRADAATAARVRSHLQAGCDQCTADLHFWTRSLAALAADRTPGPPEAVVQRAFTLVPRLPAKPSLWEQVGAVLVFDSRAQPVLAGVRDAGGSAFKLLFESGETSVDLFCEPERGEWRIAGQVLSPTPLQGGWSVSASSGEHRAETEADALGEFRLPALPPGQYELTVRGAEREILLPGVELLGE